MLMLMLMKVVLAIVLAAKKLMTRRIRYGTKVMCQTQVYAGGAENLAGIITTYITCEKTPFNMMTAALFICALQYICLLKHCYICLVRRDRSTPCAKGSQHTDILTENRFLSTVCIAISKSVLPVVARFKG